MLSAFGSEAGESVVSPGRGPWSKVNLVRQVASTADEDAPLGMQLIDGIQRRGQLLGGT